jgi:hypothetical protein
MTTIECHLYKTVNSKCNASINPSLLNPTDYHKRIIIDDALSLVEISQTTPPSPFFIGSRWLALGVRSAAVAHSAAPALLSISLLPFLLIKL